MVGAQGASGNFRKAMNPGDGVILKMVKMESKSWIYPSPNIPVLYVIL